MLGTRICDLECRVFYVRNYHYDLEFRVFYVRNYHYDVECRLQGFFSGSYSCLCSRM